MTLKILFFTTTTNLSLSIVLFLFLQLLTIFFVIFLFFCVNTIYCLLSLIGLIFCTAIVLLITGCEFFALIYLLIYIGAIIVFFLFTVMLLHLKFESVFQFEVSHAIAIPCFLVIHSILSYIILQNFSTLEHSQDLSDSALLSNFYPEISDYTAGHSTVTVENVENIATYAEKFQAVDSEVANYKIIGFIMYSKFGYLLFLVGFILLITMIGIMQVIKYAREEAMVPRKFLK